jgi:prepilin-type processing-associated H-X9-DG protein
MELANERGNIRGSFSMWDLLAIIVVVLLSGVWFVFTHTGERARIAQCAWNLRTLGQATQSYAGEHWDELPETLIRVGKFRSWDMALMPYLDPALAKPKSVYDKKRFMAAVRRYFVCPSDPFQRPNPRSYAMAGRDMRYGWPPTSHDKTGVGIIWDRNTVSILHDDDLVEGATKNHDLFPHIKQSLLPDPAHTLLLTELIAPGNRLERPTGAVVFAAYRQQEIVNGEDLHFQFGKFNYLMADGHVELLNKSQTDGSDGVNPNIWTINPKD